MNLGGFNTISFNGAIAGQTGGATGVTLWAALRAYLKSVDELSELAEIYKNRPKKGWAYPFMVISSITARDDIFNTNAVWRYTTFQFSVISDDDIQAETLGLAAYNALSPANRIKNPPLVFDGGAEIVRFPTMHGRLIEQPNRGQLNSNVWMYTFSYEFQTSHLI